MQFTIDINLDNSAFEDQEELARVLEDIVEQVRHYDNYLDLNGAKIGDINGNTVGYVRVSE